MIVVTVGTNEARFDRLLEAVGTLEDETIVVQHGPSEVRPPGARCVDYLPFDELLDLLREATTVVTHAGVGSIISALSAGKRPVVVPRLRRYREAVDDHQVPFGRRVHEAGLVDFVEDLGLLPEAVARSTEGSEPVRVAVNERLVEDLRDYVNLETRREKP